MTHSGPINYHSHECFSFNLCFIDLGSRKSSYVLSHTSLNFLILQKKDVGRGFSEYGGPNEIPLPSPSKSKRFVSQEPGSPVGINEASGPPQGPPPP